MAAVTSVVYYHNIETSNFPKLLIGRGGGWRERERRRKRERAREREGM